jgi:hypothetical protein
LISFLDQNASTRRQAFVQSVARAMSSAGAYLDSHHGGSAYFLSKLLECPICLGNYDSEERPERAPYLVCSAGHSLCRGGWDDVWAGVIEGVIGTTDRYGIGTSDDLRALCPICHSH